MSSFYLQMSHRYSLTFLILQCRIPSTTESDASTGSTRSTSSSFLRYQNRFNSKWKAKLSRKYVVERRDDGSELPVDATSSSKPWPIFNRIYKRQNQLLKKGETGEDGNGASSDDDDNDSDFSDDGVEPPAPPLAPPAPTLEQLALNGDDEIELDSLEASTGEHAEAISKTKGRNSVRSVTSGHASKSDTKAARDISPETTQESGIPTSERTEETDKASAGVDISAPTPPRLQSWSTDLAAFGASATEVTSPSDGSNHNFPTQAPTSSVTTNVDPSLKLQRNENEPGVVNAKQPRNKSKSSKPMTAKKSGDILTPLSIPRTLCYSLRSAIGDGSARQRNSHSLMERRALRPNGSHLDMSHWSQRGKRSYMEGEISIICCGLPAGSTNSVLHVFYLSTPDRYTIEHIGSKDKSKTTPITLMAVYDGHGGPECSQFCSDWMSSYVRKDEYYPKYLPLAMKSAFMKVSWYT